MPDLPDSWRRQMQKLIDGAARVGRWLFARFAPVRRWLFAWFNSLTSVPEYVRGLSQTWVKIFFGEAVLGAIVTVVTLLAGASFPWERFITGGVIVAGFFLWHE